MNRLALIAFLCLGLVLTVLAIVSGTLGFDAVALTVAWGAGGVTVGAGLGLWPE